MILKTKKRGLIKTQILTYYKHMILRFNFELPSVQDTYMYFQLLNVDIPLELGHSSGQQNAFYYQRNSYETLSQSFLI